MGNNHKSGHGTEMFCVFFVFIYLKTGRLFLRGVYLRPVRVYFKQDTGCVLMAKIIWFRSGSLSMQSGKKRAEKMRENQRFGKIDKVCLTRFGITAKIIVSNLFGSQFLQRNDSVYFPCLPGDLHQQPC